MSLVNFVFLFMTVLAALLTIGGGLLTAYRNFPKALDKVIRAKSPSIVVTTPFRYYDLELGMPHLIDRVNRFQPELIIGIARGGAIVGGILAKHLDKYVYVIDVRDDEPIRGATDLAQRARGKRVLLVDDRYDSGKTMKEAYDYLKSHASDIRTAVFAFVIYPGREDGPDICAYEVNSAGIPLPWEPGYPAPWGKRTIEARNDGLFR